MLLLSVIDLLGMRKESTHTIKFGGYEITFFGEQEPIYVQLAWPNFADAHCVERTRARAAIHARREFGDLDLIAIERRQHKGITHEIQLYAAAGAYTVAAPVDWPEEIEG